MSTRIVLDVEKLKGLSKTRTFKTKDGQEVNKKEIELNLVPLKEPKVLSSTDKYDFIKTHFICLPKTKEERESGKETIYVGEGFETKWKDNNGFNAPSEKTQSNPFLDNDEDDDLPF